MFFFSAENLKLYFSNLKKRNKPMNFSMMMMGIIECIFFFELPSSTRFSVLLISSILDFDRFLVLLPRFHFLLFPSFCQTSQLPNSSIPSTIFSNLLFSSFFTFLSDCYSIFHLSNWLVTILKNKLPSNSSTLRSQNSCIITIY